MLSAPAPAAQQPEISSLGWTGDPQQCPQWVGFPTRAGLPAGLRWSGAADVPALGAQVRVHLNGFGPAVVRAYFYAGGYLGVLCEFTQLPDWFRRQSPGVTLGHVFGRELEPPRSSPAPAINRADDWIPDYPPQDEESDDNQDGSGYPENPVDEQRD